MRARRSREPLNRESRLCGELQEAAEHLPSFRDGDRLIIMVASSAPGRKDEFGICFVGYDQDDAAIADLLVNTQAIFEANGGQMNIVFPRDLAGPN